MAENPTIKILFVCLGNICRSPLAEGILREKIRKQGLTDKVLVDSAGFEAFHRGDPPDGRATKVASRHGIDISCHRARLFSVSDFDRYSQIFVMDHNNYKDVLLLARNKSDEAKLDYLMNLVSPGENRPVPDPWYGGMHDFEVAFKMMDEATGILMETITSTCSSE